MTRDVDKSEASTGSLKVVIVPKDSGFYTCQLSAEIEFTGAEAGSDFSKADIMCDGQTPEHAIAIAFEQLAAQYRQRAEDSQNIDYLTVEKTTSGKVIEKTFHVTVHYECIIDGESKFEAMHDTLMGNLVVENAQVTLVAIDQSLQIEQAQRLIEDDDE